MLELDLQIISDLNRNGSIIETYSVSCNRNRVEPTCRTVASFLEKGMGEKFAFEKNIKIFCFYKYVFNLHLCIFPHFVYK